MHEGEQASSLWHQTNPSGQAGRRHPVELGVGVKVGKRHHIYGVGWGGWHSMGLPPNGWNSMGLPAYEAKLIHQDRLQEASSKLGVKVGKMHSVGLPPNGWDSMGLPASGAKLIHLDRLAGGGLLPRGGEEASRLWGGVGGMPWGLQPLLPQSLSGSCLGKERRVPCLGAEAQRGKKRWETSRGGAGRGLLYLSGRGAGPSSGPHRLPGPSRPVASRRLGDASRGGGGGGGGGSGRCLERRRRRRQSPSEQPR